MRPLLAPFAVLGLSAVALAAPSGPTSLDLMHVDVMFVGAHPDDDGGVLATFARYVLDEGFRASVVTATGGEGGGNATGPEAGRSLGLIRREEERRALEMSGVRMMHFLGLQDFYFTLSADEVAARWGDAYVCDVVRDVRLQRPEVIVTMWPGPGTHGQHQMASRAATLAFDRAGDPSFCPEQVTKEFLKPFAPAKLYYYEPASVPPTLSVPTDEWSRSARMRYAELKEIAWSQYRSQGMDWLQALPIKSPGKETFLRVRSRVPVRTPESHLLEGALLPAGTSPPGVRLDARPESFTARGGQPDAVAVTFVNGTGQPMTRVRLSLDAPAGWTTAAQGATSFDVIAPGAQVDARFTVQPPAGGGSSAPVLVLASYAAERAGDTVTGENPVPLRAAAPLQAAFQPLWDVAGYRRFAEQTHTESVIPALPTRIPVTIGDTTPVAIEVTNAGAEAARGTIVLDLPAGVTAPPVAYDVPPRGHATVTAQLRVDQATLPAGRHAARLPLTLHAGEGTDTADLYLLPALTIPCVSTAPVIDGDLADMAGLAEAHIGPKDLWWRKEPASDADASADVRLGWDAQRLYVGVAVHDDVVLCNIAPDDVKSQLRSDAVGVTVDPSGQSRDTSTTLQAAAFPCTTAGFQARGFRDADARQGLMEDTAPGMQVASRRTADGYVLEMAIPWSAMPQKPAAGGLIGLNVVLYDGDDKGAAVGANASESGLAWAAFPWGGKQALPYLWPRVRLGR